MEHLRPRSPGSLWVAGDVVLGGCSLGGLRRLRPLPKYAPRTIYVRTVRSSQVSRHRPKAGRLLPKCHSPDPGTGLLSLAGPLGPSRVSGGPGGAVVVGRTPGSRSLESLSEGSTSGMQRAISSSCRTCRHWNRSGVAGWKRSWLCGDHLLPKRGSYCAWRHLQH